MNKKIVFVAIVAVILSSFVTMCLKVPAEPALRVHNLKRGKDYATIQAAINDPSTQDGDTITLDDGTFPESVVLNKSLVITGKGASTVIAPGQDSAFAISASDETDISITYLAVMGARTGIRFTNCSTSNIDSVAASQCTFYGIDLNKCRNCTISRSEVKSLLTMTQVRCGINVTECSDLYIMDNRVSDSKDGFGISLSGSRIWLRRNELYNNKYNLDVKAPFLYDIDTSNLVNSKPIYYLIGNSSQSITATTAGGSGIGYLALINCVNMTARSLNLTKNGVGILLVNTTESHIESSICQDNREGIRLVDSNHNMICGNMINSSELTGIIFVKSSHNTVYENIINSSGLAGIKIESFDSSGNKIYNNDVSNNHPNVYTVYDGNEWDNGYPSGGNHWGDYTDKDLKRGPNQDEEGSDGIWDNPYAVNRQALVFDQYPLVCGRGTTLQAEVFWNGTYYTVTVSADSTVKKNLNFSYSSQEITFELSGGTFCNITIPRGLLDGGLIVSIDGQPTASVLTWNQATISAHIKYNLTYPHTIKVLGEYTCRPPITDFPDLNGDGVINILDVSLVARSYGRTLPNP